MMKKEEQMPEINQEHAEIVKKIRKDSEEMEIPGKMTNNQLSDFLNKNVEKKKKEKKRETKKVVAISSIVSIAACFLAVIFMQKVILQNGTEYKRPTKEFHYVLKNDGNEKGTMAAKNQSYDEIYQKMLKHQMADRQIYDGVYLDGVNYGVKKNAVSEDTASSSENCKSAGNITSGKEYYDTNEQTENVHESDVIKTDGEYIYILNSEKRKIVIAKPEGKETKSVQTIKLPKSEKKNENSYFTDMYVCEKRLIVLGQEREMEDECIVYDSRKSVCGLQDTQTVILVYDISDIDHIVLCNTLVQDGSYESSRLAGNYLYTISNHYIDHLTKENCVPQVYGEKIAVSDVYIPNESNGSEYVIVTSLNIFKPEKFEEKKAIASGYANIYMSENNLYLTISKSKEQDITDTNLGQKATKKMDTTEKEVKVKRRYKEYIKEMYPDLDVSQITAKEKICYIKEQSMTEIVKIDYRNGRLNVQADGSVDGYLDDNLSMDEYKNHVRVVTTMNSYSEIVDRITFYDKDGEIVGYMNEYGNKKISPYIGKGYKEEHYNNVYVLNAGLGIVAKIEGLAENEDIYATRFMGDYGYFVTYENTDPLFAVDFSDIENPKITDELKMTGYSDYLHFYSKNLLFGLGMETNAKTGNQIGLKLDMYDISTNEMKVLARKVIKNIDYTEALYNYKALMIDPMKNIVGFCGESYHIYDSDNECAYYIYSYDEKGEWKQLVQIAIDRESWSTRGMYIGEYLYIVSENGACKVVSMEDYKVVLSTKLK